MTTVNVNCIIHYKRKDKGSSKLRSRNHSMRGWAEIKCTAARTCRCCDRIFFSSFFSLQLYQNNTFQLLMPGCWQITSKCSLEIFSCMQSANLLGITLSLRQALADFFFFFNAITRQWHDHFWSRTGQNRLKLLSWPKDQAEAVLGSFQLLLCETARRGLAFHISAFMIIVLFWFFFFNWMKSIHTLITQIYKPPEQSACKRISSRHVASHERDS